MSVPGWYPDPGGAPGRFRFWDGRRWSAGTSTVPAGPPPAPSRPPTDGSRGWLVALVVLLVVTALMTVAMLVAGGRAGGTGAREDTNSASPTVSGWDERTTPTATPTPTPRPTPTSAGTTAVACPRTGNHPTTAQVPGRLTAGPLSTAHPPTARWWSYTLTYLTFLSDSHEVDTDEDPGYADVIGVGLVYPDTGFVEVRSAARQALSCVLSDEFWDRPTLNLVVDEAVMISGHPGWRVRTNSGRYNQPQGEYVDIVMVDLTAQTGALGMFYSSVALAYPDHVADADAARTALRVDG